MSFTSAIKKYTIDLKKYEGERWLQVIKSERKFARLMIDNSKKDLDITSKVLMNLFKGTIGKLYRLYGGLFIDEMEAWSEAMGISLNEVITINCQYELNHASFSLRFGCTAAAVWVQNLGMVHLRNMDWPIDEMGNATRVFEFKRGKRKFITLGVPGQIGILSGILPGAYSVTINYAPTVINPWFDGYGPLFLLREVLENCNTFDEAVNELKTTTLASNVFFMVCGIKKNQACVIERTKSESSARYIKGSYLTLGNHFKSKKFQELNWDDDLLEDSAEREDALQVKLKKLKINSSIGSLANCLDVKPTLNNDTCQQMIFIPKTGVYKVWRWN